MEKNSTPLRPALNKVGGILFTAGLKRGSEELKTSLLQKAKEGLSVVELIQFVRTSTGCNELGKGRSSVWVSFRNAFDIPVEKLSTLGAWEGYGGEGVGHWTPQMIEDDLADLFAKFR